jgi:hypothetical protein
LSEEGIFWRGGTPGAATRQAHLADDEQFVAAIRDACESAGGGFRRFISAQGAYGTWVVELERGGQRVLWNGKDECMVLQIPLTEGGWEDAIVIDVATHDQPGFVAGVSDILGAETAKD